MVAAGFQQADADFKKLAIVLYGPANEQPFEELSGSGRQVKINARVAIDLCRRHQIELVDWDFLAMLVPDIQSCPRQHIVMNLLGRAAILEDEGDCILAGREWRLRVGGLVTGGWVRGNSRIRRRRRPFVAGLPIVSLGSRVRHGRGIVIAKVVWIRKRITADAVAIGGNAIPNSVSVRRYIWSSVVIGSRVG
jgi:hypothetical protein